MKNLLIALLVAFCPVASSADIVFGTAATSYPVSVEGWILKFELWTMLEDSAVGSKREITVTLDEKRYFEFEQKESEELVRITALENGRSVKQFSLYRFPSGGAQVSVTLEPYSTLGQINSLAYLKGEELKKTLVEIVQFISHEESFCSEVHPPEEWKSLFNSITRQRDANLEILMEIVMGDDPVVVPQAFRLLSRIANEEERERLLGKFLSETKTVVDFAFATSILGLLARPQNQAEWKILEEILKDKEQESFSNLAAGILAANGSKRAVELLDRYEKTKAPMLSAILKATTSPPSADLDKTVLALAQQFANANEFSSLRGFQIGPRINDEGVLVTFEYEFEIGETTTEVRYQKTDGKWKIVGFWTDRPWWGDIIPDKQKAESVEN